MTFILLSDILLLQHRSGDYQCTMLAELRKISSASLLISLIDITTEEIQERNFIHDELTNAV